MVNGFITFDLDTGKYYIVYMYHPILVFCYKDQVTVHVKRDDVIIE